MRDEKGRFKKGHIPWTQGLSGNAHPAWKGGKKVEYNREYKRRIKYEVLSRYSTEAYPICAKCSEADLSKLSIDHINGGGNEHRARLGIPTGYAFYAWLRRNDYPEGYQVLCISHNSEHHGKRERRVK